MANKLYNDTSIKAIANAIRVKNGKTDTYTVGEMAGAISSLSGKESVTWNQCPEAPRNFVNNVTYDPNDYSTSQIENYAPATALESNTKPIGKTVDGVIYYNQVPNAETPFASTNAAGTLKPLDQLRWLKTTIATATPYSLGINTRDLGGWACDGGKVKYGMLIRGGEPNEVDKDLMVNQVGIRTELQLLPKSEARHTYSAWGIDFYANPEENSYVVYSLSNKSLWKFYLQVVFDSVSHSNPLYFHCGIGADRTGTIAVMLEALLGVSQSDIDKDYELANFFARDSSFPRRRNVDMYKNYIAEIKNVPLIGGLADTFANHAISFAVSLGFTADEINAYRNACIDGTPTQITLNLPTYTITNNLTDVVNSNTDTSITQYQDYTADLTVANGYIISDVQIKLNDTDVTDLYFTGTKTTLNYSIQKNLTNCHLDGKNTVIAGQSYVAELIADTGFTMDGATITITMGGTDMSNYYANGKIAIPNVSGNITITATAVASAPATNILDEYGYFNNTRYSLSTGNADKKVSEEGFCATGLIPITKGDTVRLKGFNFSAQSVFIFFNSEQTYLFGNNKLKTGDSSTVANSGPTIGNVSISNDNIVTYTYTDNAYNKIAYIGISGACTDGANAFATLNEDLPA